MGVWIEIVKGGDSLWAIAQSPPMWGCGLKYTTNYEKAAETAVTPYVGVWIEIFCGRDSPGADGVTPYVGVWIEIFCTRGRLRPTLRHPLCGGVD